MENSACALLAAVRSTAAQSLAAYISGAVQDTLSVLPGRENFHDARDAYSLNKDTGHPAMDIALASGNQCFRVAISLALAMGRYFG